MDFQSIFDSLVTIITTYSIIAIIAYVLLVVAWWKIFTKAGEAGWKSLIPIYNVYILFKISWKPLVFWIVIICSFASSIIGGTDSDSTILNILGWACSVAPTIVLLILDYRLSKAFGHGLPFALGLMIPALKNIFTLVLAFGKSQYVGNGEAVVAAEHHAHVSGAHQSEIEGKSEDKGSHEGGSHLK